MELQEGGVTGGLMLRYPQLQVSQNAQHREEEQRDVSHYEHHDWGVVKGRYTSSDNDDLW